MKKLNMIIVFVVTGCMLDLRGRYSGNDDLPDLSEFEENFLPEILDVADDVAEERIDSEEIIDSSIDPPDLPNEFEIEVENEIIEEETSEESIEDCSLPTPLNPLYLFFCLDAPADLTLWRWVERPADDLEWGRELGCTATNSRRLACSVTDYGSNANVYFDIAIDNEWACSLGSGLLKIWWYGSELSIETVSNQITNEAGLGNGYYIAGWHWLFQTFTTGEGGNEIQSVEIHIVDKVGTPGTLTVSVRATDNGYPTGPDLTSVSVSETSVTLGWNTFQFPDQPTLAPATQYAVIVRAPAGSYPNHFYSWDRSNNSAYPGGRAGEMNDSETIKEFLNAEVDYLFRVRQGCDYKFSIP